MEINKFTIYLIKRRKKGNKDTLCGWLAEGVPRPRAVCVRVIEELEKARNEMESNEVIVFGYQQYHIALALLFVFV